VIGLSQASFDSSNGAKRLCEVFGITALDAFGSFDRSEVSAMAGLVDYLSITQKGKLPLLRPPHKERSERVVQIDAATRRNLELTQSLSGGRAGSLLATIDRTVSPGGARLLERHLSSPSLDLPTIRRRLDAISFFFHDGDLRDLVRQHLRKTPDLDRALSRLALDRGGPRDLAAVRTALSQGHALTTAMQSADQPEILNQSMDNLSGFEDMIERLDDALVDDPPLNLRDGGFVASGYDADLDEARTLRDEGRSVIAGLQQTYANVTGISSLKIKHNNVLGYFVETTATHVDKMMSAEMSDTFIHRQTTANQVRFTTVELSDLETRILNAGNRALEIEKRVYESLKADILNNIGPLGLAANALAQTDLSAALAELAVVENWQRPTVNDSRDFIVEGVRHPVVELALRQQDGSSFVSNDCNLSSDRIWLLTGPNMAGKSTFLRQNALIALLAQIGCFVPAKRADIGLVSQIFSRVGASDDLARGRSTFMVEMVETAAILNQADDRALVILDEIGRGTATYDGLSIAWATLEHLHDVNKCRALFATHYHELTALAGRLDGVENATVAVKEWDGNVVFLHEVRKGAADRSYGVQVAQLAGLPASVIARARSVLDALEKGDREGAKTPKALIDDLPLFAAVAPEPPRSQSETDRLLSEIDPDTMSPREALDALYRLKESQS
jgi:DNA mismatch repair protein MutS